MAINSTDAYMLSLINQYAGEATTRLYRSNPFLGVVPQRPLDVQEAGTNPLQRHYRGTLPNAYPTSLDAVSRSPHTGGTGSPCNVAAERIKRASYTSTLSLYQKRFDTEDICVSDVVRSASFADQLQHFEQVISQNVTVFWSDFTRVQNIINSDNKIIISDATTFQHITGDTSAGWANASFTAVPGAELAWAHLNQIYWFAMASGITNESSVGTDSTGRLVLPLYIHPVMIEKLTRANADLKDIIKYFDPQSLLSVLGVRQVINGYLLVPDLFPIRLGATSAITTVAALTLASALYPTIQQTVTDVGTYSVANPAYNRRGTGPGAAGRADFEVATILPPEVYELIYEAPTPQTVGGKAVYDTQTYVGDIRWNNTKTYRGDNDNGNFGYYSVDIRLGTKPLNREFGYAILYKLAA